MTIKATMLALAIGSAFFATAATAQTSSFNGLTPVSGTNTGPMYRDPLPTTVNPTTDRITITSLPGGDGYGLNLSAFASQQDLTATQAQLNAAATQLNATQSQIGAFATQTQLNAATAQINTTLGQLNTATAQLNATMGQLNVLAAQIRTQIARDRQRSSEGVALASAMTILPPVQGDRFSVTVAGAGFDGQGGGSVTGTYRVAERVLLFGGYARGPTQNLVKAGVSFSFN